MASIDRHQYSEEIRRGAAKFVKDLNLDTKTSVHVPRKSINGENGMFKKVQNNLSSKLEYFQKLDKESLANSLPRKSSAGTIVSNNFINNTSHLNGDQPQDISHLNGSLITKSNGHVPESNGDARQKNRSSIGAIASFALGDSNSVESKLAAGLEAQISLHKTKLEPVGTKVTPLSRLPGQDLSLGDLVTSAASSTGVVRNGLHTAQVASNSGLHTAQVAMITNGSNGINSNKINGVVFTRQSSGEKVRDDFIFFIVMLIKFRIF